MIRVSAAVINWNNRDHILACLDSLLRQQDVTLDVVLLDNGSSDGSLDLVRARFPELKIIENGRNLGFAAAHNIGYRETSGEWHLVLNSDVVLNPDYVSRLLQAVSSDPVIGAASGKLLRFGSVNGHDIIDSVGIEIFRSRRVWDRGTGEVDQGQYEQVQRVFGCCGAAALYRRAALAQLAPTGEIFPEIYFAYYEDVDLSWRMNLDGWKSVYVPSAIGRHVRGGSTHGSALTRRLVLRNRYVLLMRNDRFRDLLRDVGTVSCFEAFQFWRMVLHPSLIPGLANIFRSVLQASHQRKGMKLAGRASFGLSTLNQLVSPGSGLRGWLKQARNASR